MWLIVYAVRDGSGVHLLAGEGFLPHMPATKPPEISRVSSFLPVVFSSETIIWPSFVMQLFN